MRKTSFIVFLFMLLAVLLTAFGPSFAQEMDLGSMDNEQLTAL